MSEIACRKFDQVVHGLVRMELLDVNAREAALEHASRCASCAERMAEAMALAEASEFAGKAVQDMQTPPRVEAALVAAFRTHHRRAAWRRTLEWSAVGAAAAVLLAFVWISGGRSNGQPPAASPGKSITSRSDAPVDAQNLAVPKKEQPAQQSDKELAATSARETYRASDFVPVPLTGGFSPDDPGMIVRVQLTRESLAQLGYPIANTPDEDLIRADVLVGEDGWPRGVKLVR
jgi:hypothetical protein